jgi:hypothetical protein
MKNKNRLENNSGNGIDNPSIVNQPNSLANNNKSGIEDLLRSINDDFNSLSKISHQKAILESTPKLEFEDVNALIKSTYVSPDDDILEEEVILSIKGEHNYNAVSALGGICTIMGKPKSRKTMFLSLLIGNFINPINNYGILNSKMPEKKKILVFDTEQSRRHIKRIYSRVEKIAQTEDVNNLLVFSLRQFNPAERVKLIEVLINHFKDAFLVIIDGIRDLVFDINNISESTILTSKLMSWSKENNIHIINVIHQNKSDNNARGHLGTELTNKSDSVISVASVDSKTSVVKAVKTRDMEFNTFSFEVDSDGIPFLLDNTTGQVTKKTRKIFTMENISLDEHRNFLNRLFLDGLVVGYSNLKSRLKNEWIASGFELGDAIIVKLIKFYSEYGLIFKDGSTRPSKYLIVL